MTQPLVKKRVVWCIGGVDSSGGAGITRDAITLADLDVHACVLTTQLTVQSNSVMLSRNESSVSALNAQWQVLWEDTPPSAIKIGALANDEQAQLICARLQSLDSPRPFVVWDPVFRTSSGGQLGTLSQDTVTELLKSVDVVTPNTDELCSLTNSTRRLSSVEDMKAQAKQLLALGAHSVLVKGGHLFDNESHSEVCDVFVTPEQTYTFSVNYSSGGKLRGTGCMLASALCAFVARHYDVPDALTLAVAYVNQVRQYCEQLPSATHFARTTGFPQCPSAFPTVDIQREGNKASTEIDVKEARDSYPPFAPLIDKSLGIYPVVDSIHWLKMLLPTGVKVMQLRLKEGSDSEIRQQISQAIALTSDTECQLFINDYWEWAIELGAYGVHLGQEDLDTADLNAIQRAGLRLGVSTHGYAEIQRVKKLKPSYIALGHIFPTTTKDMPSSPQGVSRLANYVPLCEGIPTVAIGGITLSRVQAVAQTQIDSIAVVTAITQADNPLMAYRQLAEEAGFA
jgi:hydroxymethylpyrimidine kinase/phosphomethylpyrimidine kinase/thiamine-phosphate diphosphorylase